MRESFNIIIGLLLLAGSSQLAFAQHADRLHSSQPSPFQQGTLTGKERLGSKWTDDQRIDNCNVPVDKRGTKPRLSACANHPSS